MKILDRYLFRQFASTFVLLVIALPFLFLITDLTDNLDKYLDRGLSVPVVALSYLYFIPQLIFWGFPVAALIATVFTIGGMTRHQEVTAAKAGGVSFYRLATPLILLAALLSGASVAIGELVPIANQKRAETLGERARINSPFRLDFVFRTENGKTLAASRINAETGAMFEVVLESRTPDGSMTVNQSAATAEWDEYDGWTLRNGYLRWLPDDGPETAFQFGYMYLPDLQEEPEQFLIEAKNADEMRYRELERLIRTVDRSGGDSSEFRVKLAQKLSLPLALFVIVLFGAPLATSSQRGGTAFGVGVSLAVTMVYLMMFKVGEAVGTSGTVHPLIAAWSPNVMFLVASIVLLWKVRT